MKKILIPIILLFVGIGGGVGAGFALRPPLTDKIEVSTEDSSNTSRVVEETENDLNTIEPPVEGVEYAKLNDQFIVPLIEDGEVKSLVVLTLSVEVETGGLENIYAVEPKLRDGFLQVMFDHANIGGFSGNYTESAAMRTLRLELLRSARQITGPIVTDVLILDILRQDL